MSDEVKQATNAAEASQEAASEAPAQDAAEKGKPLSRALKLFYGVGDCGFTLMTNVETYYFNFFLTNLAQFPVAVATTIATIASFVDAGLSWIYGAILNSIKPKKWGRYRSWLALAPWIVPFLFAFQFIKVSENPTLSAVVVTVAAVISHVAWNLPYVANVSMIAVAGKTPEDRAQLASTRAAWANFSKIIFGFIAPPLASFLAGVIGETNQYGATAFCLAWVMVVLYFVHFKMFDGYEEVPTEEQLEAYKKAKAEADKDRTSGLDLIKALFNNPPLLILMLADLSKWAFNFVCGGIAVYYFTYVAQDAGMLATYILITNIACVIGSYLAKNISKVLSTRMTAILTFVFMAVVLFAARFMFTNMWVVIVLCALAQFGYGIAYACTPALYADTIVYSEWKTGKNATGWISGLQNVPLKIGVLLRGIVIGAVLAAANFSADIDPAAATVELQEGICNGFMTIPAILLLVSAALLFFGFRITKDKVEQYQREIDARNATAETA